MTMRPRPLLGIFRALAVATLLGLGACAPTVIGLGPTSQEAVLDADRIIARDGAILPMTVWRTAAAPRAVIIALHGFTDYSNAFALPASGWAAQGIQTYAYDQRGFGRGPNRGRWAGNEALVADAGDAFALLRARHRDTPIYVLGESMGGAVAMIAASTGAFDSAQGVILVAPAVRGSEALGSFATGTLRTLANAAPWLSGPTGAAGIRPTDNIAMLRALSRDPLILRNPRVDMTWGLVQLMDEAVAAAPALRLPTLVLVGAHDILIPDGAMMRTLARIPIGGAPPRVAVYDNGWHMLLRDLDAARVQRDIAHWVTARGGDRDQPLPSGADRNGLLAQRLPR